MINEINKTIGLLRELDKMLPILLLFTIYMSFVIG